MSEDFGLTGNILPLYLDLIRFLRTSYPTLPGVAEAPSTTTDLGSKKFLSISICYLVFTRLPNDLIIPKKVFIAIKYAKAEDENEISNILNKSSCNVLRVRYSPKISKDKKHAYFMELADGNLIDFSFRNNVMPSVHLDNSTIM